jgi:hypothetical protein
MQIFGRSSDAYEIGPPGISASAGKSRNFGTDRNIAEVEALKDRWVLTLGIDPHTARPERTPDREPFAGMVLKSSTELQKRSFARLFSDPFRLYCR